MTPPSRSFSRLTLCLSAACAASAPASAQLELADASAFFEPLPTVLTASRMAQSTLDAPAPVTVIDREMIEAAGFTEIHEILRLAPGFLVADWADGAPTVANHGLGDAYGRRVKVMIDGRTVNNPFWGDVYWQDLPIRVDDIERIEVVRGPHGAAYGANAFEGVVNIITRSPLTEAAHQVIGRYGRDGFRDLGVRINGNHPGGLDWRLTASRRSMENFRRYGGGSIESLDRNVLNVQAVYPLSPRDELRFQAGAMHGYDHRGYPAGVNYPVRTEEVGEAYAHLAWQRSFSADSEFSLQYYHHGRRVRAGWPVMMAGRPIPVDIDLDTARDDLELQHSQTLNETLHLLWGGGVRRDAVRSARYFGTREVLSSTQWQVFGSLTWQAFAGLSVNLGGTLEHHDYSGSLFSPRLGLNYALSPADALRLSAGRAYRAPSYMESKAREGYLYEGQIVRMFYFAGLPLSPEKVDHAEFGYNGRFAGQGIDLDARVFWERYRDHIDDEVCSLAAGARNPCAFAAPDRFAALGSSSVYYFLNQGGVTIRGTEGRLDWRRPGWGRVVVSQAFIDIGQVSGKTDSDIERSAPASMTSVLLIKELPARWWLSLGYYHQGPMNWLNDGDALPSRDLFDLKVAHRFGASGKENELALTWQSMGGAYVDFHEGRYRREPRLFASLKLSL